jgi:hypothetical protein
VDLQAKQYPCALQVHTKEVVDSAGWVLLLLQCVHCNTTPLPLHAILSYTLFTLRNALLCSQPMPCLPSCSAFLL